MTFPPGPNLYLPRPSRATVGKMNPPAKRGIMVRYKHLFPVERREYGVWT